MKKFSIFRRYRYQIPAILYALLIFALSSVPGNEYPEEPFINFDKFVHFTEYAVFALLLIIALRKSGKTTLVVHWKVSTFLIGVTYGLLDEIHQYFVPLRQTSAYDLMADASGILAAIIIVWIWAEKFSYFQPDIQL